MKAKYIFVIKIVRYFFIKVNIGYTRFEFALKNSFNYFIAFMKLIF